MDTSKFGYFSKTVADQLGTKSDTLRSWARELERFGVEFEKNEKEQRIYSDKDVRAFAEMQKLLELGHALFKVARHVAEEWEKGVFDEGSEDNHAPITPSMIRNNHEEITPQSWSSEMEKFKSEIVSSVVKELKGKLPPSNNDEVLKSILETLQELRENTSQALQLPSGENPLESKFEVLEKHLGGLVGANHRIADDLAPVHQRNVELEKEVQRLAIENERLQKEKEEAEEKAKEQPKKKKLWGLFGG